MRGLLDDETLNGVYEVNTALRPVRYARPVTGVTAALKQMERLCQVWGGSGHPLLPVVDGEVTAEYLQLLASEAVDEIAAQEDVVVAAPPRYEVGHPWDYPVLVLASGEPKERWRPVVVAELADDDPWRPVYAACLGTLPAEPDARLLDFALIVPGSVGFDDVVPVERERPVGSLDDLVARLGDDDRIHPRELSSMWLANGLPPDTGFMYPQQVLPDPTVTRRAAGPNVLVVVADGSVDDVALLWNLRCAHGDGRLLPIGVPEAELTAEVLHRLNDAKVARRFGLTGGALHVTSVTADLERAATLAAAAPSVRVVPHRDLLTFGPGPGRPRTHVASWTDGTARLEPLNEDDEKVLRPARRLARQPHLLLEVYVHDHLLPRDPTMRGPASPLPGPVFRSGAAQVRVPTSVSRESTAAVRWPTTWTCLQAVAHTRGLAVDRSEPGMAAEKLVEALGGIAGLAGLAHRPLIELLYRLAERSGMAWWRRRWARLQQELTAAGVDAATIEHAASVRGRDDAVIAPAGEGRALRFEEFRTALGRDARAAARWLAWAERHHLVVRGSDVTCPACRARSWVPLASLPPPVTCVACGRAVDQPYEAKGISFSYRIGETLRRVLEIDGLGHLFAMRWLTRLFTDRGLVGAHPGVVFTDPATGQTVGEADVLLLFTDGQIVPVEVKRRAAALTTDVADSLDQFADRLTAPWEVLAACEPARVWPAAAVALERRLPDRPRLLLSDDQMLDDDFPVWAVGADPFEWDPLPEDREAAQRERLVRLFRDVDPDEPDPPVNPADLLREDYRPPIPPAADQSGQEAPTPDSS